MLYDNRPPRYREGWDDIVALIAERDRRCKDPLQGPTGGYARFMWKRSMWGWEDDMWMQQDRIHDASEIWHEHGILTIRCSCGLEADVPSSVCEHHKWSGRSGHHNYHVNQSCHRCIDIERAFYSAPGHRDAFYQTDEITFAAAITTDSGWEYHLWCSHCGDLGDLPQAVTRDFDIDRDAIAQAITVHGYSCEAKRVAPTTDNDSSTEGE